MVIGIAIVGGFVAVVATTRRILLSEAIIVRRKRNEIIESSRCLGKGVKLVIRRAEPKRTSLNSREGKEETD
jgi:hypothetical protein